MDLNSVLNWAFLVALLTSGIRLATPVLLAVLGEIVTEKAGVLNLGLEGVMAMGAVTGFLVSLYSFEAGFGAWSPWLGLLAGTLAGMLMGLLMAWLSVTLKADQVVCGVTLVIFGEGLANYIYRQGISTLLVAGPGMKAWPIPVLSEIPVIGPVLFNHVPAVYLTVFLTFLVWLLLNRTTLGLTIRAVGENPAAGDTSGVNVSRVRYVGVLIGTALAGLGGAVLTVVQLNMFREGITAGRGWIAIALVIFAAWRPWWALAGALFFGLADAIQYHIQVLGDNAIPYEFLLMLPYVVTLIALFVRSRAGRSDAPAALSQPYLMRRVE